MLRGSRAAFADSCSGGSPSWTFCRRVLTVLGNRDGAVTFLSDLREDYGPGRQVGWEAEQRDRRDLKTCACAGGLRCLAPASPRRFGGQSFQDRGRRALTSSWLFAFPQVPG